jgi:hypothetical protein
VAEALPKPLKQLTSNGWAAINRGRVMVRKDGGRLRVRRDLRQALAQSEGASGPFKLWRITHNMRQITQFYATLSRSINHLQMTVGSISLTRDGGFAFANILTG